MSGGDALGELDRRVIRLLQGDIPLSERPFTVLADMLGTSEEGFLARLKALAEKGVMRRFGATLRHQEAGFGANAMVVWVVPEAQVGEIGELFAGFRQVTHCYERLPQEGWPYTLYTMVHGPTRRHCLDLVAEMARASGIAAYEVLFSEKEFKKTSMAYF